MVRYSVWVKCPWNIYFILTTSVIAVAVVFIGVDETPQTCVSARCCALIVWSIIVCERKHAPRTKWSSSHWRAYYHHCKLKKEIWTSSFSLLGSVVCLFVTHLSLLKTSYWWKTIGSWLYQLWSVVNLKLHLNNLTSNACWLNWIFLDDFRNAVDTHQCS